VVDHDVATNDVGTAKSTSVTSSSVSFFPFKAFPHVVLDGVVAKAAPWSRYQAQHSLFYTALAA
jgi:hypothetical protein